LLGFSVADIMDLSFDDTVVDLLSGGDGEGHIKINFSSSVLFSVGRILGMTFRIDGN